MFLRLRSWLPSFYMAGVVYKTLLRVKIPNPNANCISVKQVKKIRLKKKDLLIVKIYPFLTRELRKTERTTIQRRIFLAFSDFAILVALKDQPMTGYAINKYFVRKVGDIASVSTLYSTLANAERSGLIKSVKNRGGRTYALTTEGEKIVKCISNTIEEGKRFLDKLLS